MGAKRNILALHRRIAKDNARTIEANSKGGRYYKATLADKLEEVASKRQTLLERLRDS